MTGGDYELPDGLIVQDGDSVIVAHIVYNYSSLTAVSPLSGPAGGA